MLIELFLNASNIFTLHLHFKPIYLDNESFLLISALDCQQKEIICLFILKFLYKICTEKKIIENAV